MMKQFLLERCKAYLLAQAAIPHSQKGHQKPAITISRETGAGAVTIAKLLADYLQVNQANTNCPWAIFDRNLIEHVLQEHLLPGSLAAFMEENAKSSVKDAIEEILGLHPSSWTLLQHTSETILKLAQHGNAIIVGRGSHIITAKLRNVFHVRLVAPMEQRITHIGEHYNLNPEDAKKFVLQWDQARESYLKQNFEVHIDNPLDYHLTVNTGRISYEETAKLIGDTVLNCYQIRICRKVSAL